MIQFYSLMWVAAFFFGVMGYLRGWNRELLAASGIVLTMFGLFQFDAFLRVSVYALLPRDQVFLLQVFIFLAIVYLVYQTSDVRQTRRGTAVTETVSSSFLGVLAGAFNGYLIIGTLWYFLDINEYPFSQWVVAPAPGSPSAQNLGLMPLMLIGGGSGGSGDLLALSVIGLLFFVLVLS
ncbi:hypothetical protein HC776_01390 [bacterium]|nr:hypothetical protein [bacterium]